jgi:hypothetical protein
MKNMLVAQIRAEAEATDNKRVRHRKTRLTTDGST